MVQVEKRRWVILRGLGRGYGHWGSFQEKMRQEFSNDLCYFIDIPGNGLLNQLTSPLKISEYIAFMQTQLQQSDFYSYTGPVYGVGLSLGGMIMTEWITQQPDFFKKVFIINTSASNFSKPWDRMSTLVMKNALKQLTAKRIEDFELNSLKITTGLSEDQIRNEFGKDYQSNIDFTKKYPITTKNIFRQLIAAFRYKFPNTVKTPVVLINGAKDKFVNPKCTTDIAAHWKCPVVTDRQGGHDIAFEDAKWLIQQFKEMI